MGQLDGRIGIVTGAASGIGAACARVLSREGAKLVLTDLDDAAGQRLASRPAGSTCTMRDRRAGWPAVIAAAERLGGLHILVANAGIGIMGSAIDMSLADWRRQMAMNVDGVFLTVKYGVPADAPLRRRVHGDDVLGRRHQGARPIWRVTARPRARCGCSPSRSPWSARQRATKSG